MTDDIDKPLPSLPAGSNLVTLSVEARNHRAALIGHFLKDLNEPGIESRRDRWIKVFEDVLDSMGKHIKSADWLNSIKRGTEFKKLAGPATAVKKAPESLHLNNPNIVEISGKDKGEKVDGTDVSSFPLQQLRILAAAPPQPPPRQTHLSHLVLCLDPHGTRPPSMTEDQGVSILPANVGCIFSVGNFLLPHSNRQDDAGSVLFGLDGLKVDMWGSPLRLVGGTFTLKGVNSALQHQLLSKVLKLAIYTHFSLILEQNILSDSSVHLTLTQLKVSRSSPSTPDTTPIDTAPAEGVGFRTKYSVIPSSFTNFFSRHNLRYHGAETVGEVGNKGSMDLVRFPSHQVAEIPPNKTSPENPHDVHFAERLRRLSFMGEKRLSFLRGHHREPSREGKGSIRPHPFANALRRVEGSRGFLSTSVGVKIPRPKIMTDLAEKERTIVSQSEAVDQKPVQRLRADEKAALTSLLGWDGKDAEGRGMSGILGFLRQQEISVLISHHPIHPAEAQQRTPSASVSSSASGYSTIQSASTLTRTGETSSTIVDSSNFQRKIRPCGKPSWVTYQYFSCSSGEDFVLGDWLKDIAKQRHNPCSAKPGCGLTGGQHEKRIIHDGIRIVVRVADSDKAGERSEDEEKQPVAVKVEEDQIFVWESCAICAAKTPQKMMSTGSQLFSYAKYLEILLYSPLVCSLTPTLCEHTTPPSAPWSTLPSSRFNIVRHFTTDSANISFSLSPIEEIFELRAPLLQILRGVDKAASPFTKVEHSLNADGDQSSERKVLRRQIRTWWEGVSDHLDKIEQALSSDSHLPQKALPRLPSSDEAYEVFDAEANGPPTGLTTPRFLAPVPLPVPPTSQKIPSESSPDGSYLTKVPNTNSDLQTPKHPIIPSKEVSERQLISLRQNFQHTERSLYSHLAKTPDTSLNDIRRAFLFAGKGTQKRLKAWQDKHLGSARSKVVGDLVASEPEWWGKGCHIVPNSNITVRENDWGSIIAHTLSTVDYQLEMADLSSIPTSRHTNQGASSSAPSTSSAFFSLNTGYRLFSSSKNQPDPDQEDIVWNEPEQYTAIISRKEHGRDVSGLPSILGRKVTPSQLTSDGISAPNGMSSTAPKANADIALNAEVIVGVVSGPGVTQKAEKLLHEYEEVTPTASRQETPKPEQISTTSPVVRSSTISNESKHDGVNKGTGLDPPVLDTKPLPPALPAKDDVAIGQGVVVTLSDPMAQPLPNTSSSFSMSLTTGLNSALKYLGGPESPSRFLGRGLPNTENSGSRRVDMHTINDRPHIRYDWTMGKRVKFSCTVYYAKQFELLRKKCGIYELFVTSLSKSANWAAEGGKSKSNFWKTSDDRFIIKTLVNAWNVADLQVLIDHAPSYFRYMDATSNKPTVLAKLMGFYTVEIKNLETGVIQAKTDLLVMENLFYGRNILKKFDLKGIQGRKVKTPGNLSKTLFDGEWIEGQQKTLTLVRPHSKVLLQDAIKNDAEFLSTSNIMDYSLLLGVDEEKKEIACGLVDTIGSYTFAKTLEYKAKQGLQAGKEVTVMPPAEYQERFVKTLNGYFVACPDKWSKPLDESKIINDTLLLPSVL